MDQFLTALLGTHPSLEDLRALLADKAEGTPLFLEEMVRALVACGALGGEPGRYEATRPVTDLVIPSSVQSVIAARIRQLDEVERQVLQVAAVIGRNVSRPLLQDLLGGIDLDAALSRLQELEFLFEVQSFPHTEYTFKHALTLGAAYDSLLREDRRELHRAVFAAMARLYAGSLTHHIEQLSEHAFRAEQWEPAAHYLLLAAGRAEERSAYAAAAQFLEKARIAVAALPRTPETLAQAIDLRVRMRPAYGAIGEYRKALGPLLEARELAMELGDPQRISDVLLHLSYLNSSHGRFEEALEPAETLNRAATANGVERCISESDLAASQALILRSRAREVLARLAPHEERFTRLWRLERFGQIGARSVWFLGHRAQAQARLGLFTEADRTLAELRQVVSEVARPVDSCAEVYFTGVVEILRGPDRATVERLRRAVSEASCAGRLLVQGWLLVILGQAEVMLGELQTAYATLERAVTEAESMDLPQFECHARAVLASLRARLGEPEAAANLGHALDLARQRQDPWSEILALRGFAELRPARASTRWLEEACALARQSELRPELARSLHALGLAQRRTDPALAAATLAEADALCEEMGLRDRAAGGDGRRADRLPARKRTAAAISL